MIERVVTHLRRGGIDEVILSLGYRPDAFRRRYPDGTIAGAAITYVVEPEPLDTAGAIRFAAESGNVDAAFVVVNGDVLCDLDLAALVRFHAESRAEATIALTPVEDPSAFGVVPTDDAGRVVAFIEKPPRDSAPTNFINAGIYVLEPSVLQRIPEGRRVSVEREIFPSLADAGALYALRSDAYWIDTGTPAAYLAVQHDILSGRRAGFVPPVDGARQVRPGVWVLGSATGAESARPPSFISTGARIAPGAHVAGSVVGSGAQIDAGAVVEGSVLFSGVRVGAEAVVSGSVVGAGAVISEHAEVTEESVVGDGTVVPAGVQVRSGRVPETGVVS